MIYWIAVETRTYFQSSIMHLGSILNVYYAYGQSYLRVILVHQVAKQDDSVLGGVLEDLERSTEER